MKMRHMLAAAVLLPVLATGCTARARHEARATPSASPSVSLSPPACATGAIRWGAAHRKWRLVGLSPVKRLNADAGRTTFRYAPVRTVVARVEASDARVSGRRVMALLARHLGLENGELMPPGASTEDHRLRAERTRVHGAGRFLTAEAVLTLDAGFTLTCAGRTVRGSVTTWQQSFAQDAFRCGTDPGTDAWAREAYERGCGPLGS
ncbi:hypothetical protein ABT203_32800 [Streptomyces sp900105245]|uniref:hypothetical protein n=1 Tax=Streptomyces sp. 900105245 TaxID=3154379 RepID=UPI003326CA76